MMENASKLLDHAISFATLAHKGQVDKGGLPYILHPLAVMLSLPADDWEGRIVAVLHDVVEDTGAEINLIGFLFGNDVADAVDAISKRGGENKRQYWERCKANTIAARVKVADMKHNSSPERLAVLSEGEREYLAKKYEEGLKFFQCT